MKCDIWELYETLTRKFQISLQSDMINRYCTWRLNVHLWQYLAEFFLEWEIFQTKVVEKIKTHSLCSVTFVRKSFRLWDNVDKYCRAGQATEGNMVHAHCMLDTQGYKHTQHRICNSYCFSIATVVARTRLHVTLYVHCL